MSFAVEFLPVGDSDGDAILIQYGTAESYFLTLLDGGYASNGKQVVEHIHEHYGRNVIIHNMVVSHSDNDHAAGLYRGLQELSRTNTLDEPAVALCQRGCPSFSRKLVGRRLDQPRPRNA